MNGLGKEFNKKFDPKNFIQEKNPIQEFSSTKQKTRPRTDNERIGKTI